MGTVLYSVVNGQLLSETRNGVRSSYVTDGLGSTLALLDSTGAKTDTFSYFPSGTVAGRTGTTPTPFQWNGGSGYYQNSSNRVYVRARNFYVNLGRWSTQDPIGFKAGDYNLYRYVNNRFMTLSDPSGLATGSCYKLAKHVIREKVSYKFDKNDAFKVRNWRDVERSQGGWCPADAPFNCALKCKIFYVGSAQYTREKADTAGRVQMWEYYSEQHETATPHCPNPQEHIMAAIGKTARKAVIKLLDKILLDTTQDIENLLTVLGGSFDGKNYTTSSTKSLPLKVKENGKVVLYDWWTVESKLDAIVHEYSCGRTPEPTAHYLYMPWQLWEGGHTKLL